MTPEFIVAVVPLMQDVLALADRAATGKAGPVDAERALLRARFDATASRCRGPLAEDWELAGYALAAAADELMIVERGGGPPSSTRGPRRQPHSRLAMPCRSSWPPS